MICGGLRKEVQRPAQARLRVVSAALTVYGAKCICHRYGNIHPNVYQPPPPPAASDKRQASAIGGPMPARIATLRAESGRCPARPTDSDRDRDCECTAVLLVIPSICIAVHRSEPSLDALWRSAYCAVGK